MAQITTEKTMRLDGITYDQWKELVTNLEEDRIWYVESTNEDGYNIIDGNGDSPFPAMVRAELISNEQAREFENMGYDNIIVIFD
jgi:hypothetical protein